MSILEDKVIVVTGAGGGIGGEIAKLAAAEGAKVVVNDLGCDPRGDGADRSAAIRIVDEIVAAGGQAVPNGDSVATWGGAHAIIQSAIDAYGRIDGVVNNAGILRDKLFHHMSEEQWRTVTSVNLDGCFFTARAAAPHFREQGSGAFVHMTSSSGLIGNFGQVNYGTAKMGVAGLSKLIALDMQRFGVRSNAVAPWAYTRIIEQIKVDTEENRARVEAIKLMTPDKVAPLVIALLSDATAHVSGQVFGVRRNEIMLFSQPRPIRTIHTSDGWTPATCIERAIPALEQSFFPTEISSQVIGWDPV